MKLPTNNNIFIIHKYIYLLERLFYSLFIIILVLMLTSLFNKSYADYDVTISIKPKGGSEIKKPKTANNSDEIKNLEEGVYYIVIQEADKKTEYEFNIEQEMTGGNTNGMKVVEDGKEQGDKYFFIKLLHSKGNRDYPILSFIRAMVVSENIYKKYKYDSIKINRVPFSKSSSTKIKNKKLDYNPNKPDEKNRDKGGNRVKNSGAKPKEGGVSTLNIVGISMIVIVAAIGLFILILYLVDPRMLKVYGSYFMKKDEGFKETNASICLKEKTDKVLTHKIYDIEKKMRDQELPSIEKKIMECVKKNECLQLKVESLSKRVDENNTSIRIENNMDCVNDFFNTPEANDFIKNIVINVLKNNDLPRNTKVNIGQNITQDLHNRTQQKIPASRPKEKALKTLYNALKRSTAIRHRDMEGEIKRVMHDNFLLAKAIPSWIVPNLAPHLYTEISSALKEYAREELMLYSPNIGDLFDPDQHDLTVSREKEMHGRGGKVSKVIKPGIKIKENNKIIIAARAQVEIKT